MDLSASSVTFSEELEVAVSILLKKTLHIQDISSGLDEMVDDSARTLKFAANGAQDRLERIESANLFAAKLGEKIVGVAFSEAAVSLISVKLGTSGAFGRSTSKETDSKSAAEIVNISLARHLEGVALESMADQSLTGSPKDSPKILLERQQSNLQISTPRTSNPLQGNLETQAWSSQATQSSDLVLVVCFRSTPNIGQPAFPFNGAVLPLHLGCTVIGRGKLQCVHMGTENLIEIPHNSISKRHAKISGFYALFCSSLLRHNNFCCCSYFIGWHHCYHRFQFYQWNLRRPQH